MARVTATLRSPTDFGLVLQQARLARGLTQTDLAQELGVPQSTVSELESGRATIMLRRLIATARATGLEFSATWDDTPPPRSDTDAPGS